MPETLPYSCPHCNSVLHVKSDLIGEEVTCPKCERVFVVPAPEGRALRGNADRPREDTIVANATNNERTLEVVHPVMFRARPLSYLGWLLLAAVGVSLLVMGLASTPVDLWGVEVAGSVLRFLGAASALIGLGALLSWWIRTRFRTLTITTRRIEFQKGLIARTVSEVRHDDVRNIQIDQSMLQRLMNVGKLAISSAGQDEMEIEAHGVPAPEHIVELIRAHQE